MWHKENMINVAVKQLLPDNWKAMAWIDGDVEFENPRWASDALKLLNGHKNVLQLFSQCLDNNSEGMIMNIHTSAGFQYEKHKMMINRQYCERWKILVKYDFSPTTYLQYDQDGILIPSDKFPEGLKQDIMKYFAIRNEDE